MKTGVGAGAAVAGRTGAADLWQSIMQTVRTVAVRAGVAGGWIPVGRVIVAGSTVG